MLDGQVGKNVVLMFGRVAAVGHHGGDKQLRPCDSVRWRIDEPLLDTFSLIGVACPRESVRGLDVKIPDPALALRQLGFGLEFAVAFTGHPVVFRAEALLKPAAAMTAITPITRAATTMTATTMATMIPVDMKSTCCLVRDCRAAGRMSGSAGG